jgi:alanine-synthesizing transaminase
LQIASCTALNGPQDCVEKIRMMYQSRRDVLIDGMHKMGWMAEKPKASMFVWAEIPDEFKALGSLEFSKRILKEGSVAISPGIGFGDYGDNYVRIALIENEHRIRQALRGIRQFLNAGG